MANENCCCLDGGDKSPSVHYPCLWASNRKGRVSENSIEGGARENDLNGGGTSDNVRSWRFVCTRGYSGDRRGRFSWGISNGIERAGSW